jgi:hypothetical protein
MPGENEVRELAYSLWQAAGSPSGQDYEYWFAAERQLLAPDDRKYGDQGDGIDPMEEPEKVPEPFRPQ